MEKFLAEIGLERFATNLKGFELRDLALFDGHDWRSLGIPETSDKVKIKRALEKKLAPNNERSGPHAAHSMATTTADTYTDANLRTVGVPQEQMGSDKLCMIRNVIANCVAQHVVSEENTHDLSSYMKDMQDLINTHATMPNTAEQYKNLQTYFNNKFDHDIKALDPVIAYRMICESIINEIKSESSSIMAQTHLTRANGFHSMLLRIHVGTLSTQQTNVLSDLRKPLCKLLTNLAKKEKIIGQG